MEEECVELYGMTGTFFSTNKAYHIPYHIPFHPFPDMLPAADEEATVTSIPARAPALAGEADEEGFGLASSGRSSRHRSSRNRLSDQSADRKNA